MGRIVGDGAINFDIVDVAVDPAHQGKRPWPAGDGSWSHGWTLTPLMAPTLRWWRMCRNCTRSSASKAFARRARGWPASGEPAVVSSHFLPERALSKWQLVLRRVPHYAERHSHREDPMTRFLLCSFALVLLYPSGIDMYLVGLPRIAQDPGPARRNYISPSRSIWPVWPPRCCLLAASPTARGVSLSLL